MGIGSGKSGELGKEMSDEKIQEIQLPFAVLKKRPWGRSIERPYYFIGPSAIVIQKIAQSHLPTLIVPSAAGRWEHSRFASGNREIPATKIDRLFEF